MGDDWRPGDLALCVSHDEIECDCGCTAYVAESAPPKGSIRVVVSVGIDLADCGQAFEYLVLNGGSEPLSLRCRKVTPDAADEFDRETIALLNGSPLPAPPAPKTEEVGK